jgi:ssDNA-binding Zn-finger/Zn-ribbon topoisomerase 1
MAIRKESDIYVLECDECGEESDKEFDDFYEAVAFKKDRSNNWLSTKDEDGLWKDICPECKQRFLREKYK